MEYFLKLEDVEIYRYQQELFMLISKWANHRVKIRLLENDFDVILETLEGPKVLSEGDYIVKSRQGECELCKAEQLRQYYAIGV